MLEDGIKSLALGKNIAAVTTLLPDGTPMTHAMWVDADDDHIVVNTEVHRQKFRNITRDPRVTVAIWGTADGHPYCEVRGRVVETVTGPEARAHIDRLARKYTGRDYAKRVGSERVVVKIRPDRARLVP